MGRVESARSEGLAQTTQGAMRNLLQRLLRALPLMEQWLDELHATQRSKSVPASDTGFERLATCFPESLLQSTRSVSVDQLPFPPVSEFGLPEFEAMAAMPKSGITFGDMYFVQPTHSSEGIHFHELVHVVQWNTLGVRPFLLTYAVGLAQYGYDQSPLEAIAYDLQYKFEHGTALTTVPQLVALHAVDARNSAATVFEMNGLKLGA
jgi:hypothetical protein